MSKLDVGVGDEFPLAEGSEDRRQMDRHSGRHHHRHHHQRLGHHHHHHGPHGFGRFAMLLVIAGLVALIVEHKLPAEAAYGMIALGLIAIVLMFARHWRHHRHMTQQES
jgi:ABC-type Zn2+ transport system substrate-binding protein/surface adhesin